MAKKQKDNVETPEATEATESKTERTKRGQGLGAQIKNHFKTIMLAFTSGTGLDEALAAAVDTYNAIPANSVTVGMSPEQRLQEITAKIDEIFNSGNIDRKELRLLLDKQDKLEKQIAKKAEQAATASA